MFKEQVHVYISLFTKDYIPDLIAYLISLGYEISNQNEDPNFIDNGVSTLVFFDVVEKFKIKCPHNYPIDKLTEFESILISEKVKNCIQCYLGGRKISTFSLICVSMNCISFSAGTIF